MIKTELNWYTLSKINWKNVYKHTVLYSIGNGYVEFEEYEKFMKKELKKLDYEQKLFRDAFKKFDKDGSGFVSFEELKKALCGKGDKMSDEDVQYFFDEADLNKDGKIDYEGKASLEENPTTCQSVMVLIIFSLFVLTVLNEGQHFYHSYIISIMFHLFNWHCNFGNKNKSCNIFLMKGNCPVVFFMTEDDQFFCNVFFLSEFVKWFSCA